MEFDFHGFMSDTVKVFELVGVAILITGSLLASVQYGRALLRGTPPLGAFLALRATLGRAILLGLEVLVVADIVQTIVVDPTLDSAIGLGVIVLVRIALSFAIDVEIDGVSPWRKRRDLDEG